MALVELVQELTCPVWCLPAVSQDAFDSDLTRRKMLHPARTGGQDYPNWGDTSN